MYRVFILPGMLALALLPVWIGNAAAQSGAAPISRSQAASPSGTATGAPTLTLRQALDHASAVNPELSAMRYESAAVAATIRQADTLPNPEVAMTVEDRRRDTRTTAWELSQPIELGGKRAARVAAASRAHDAAQADLQAKAADTHALVITSFIAVLHAQERERLAEQAWIISQRGVEIASRRVAAGKVSPVEATRARIAAAAIRLESSQAASELALARRRLAATWAGTPDSFGMVDGQLEAIPALPAWESVLARLQESPALQRAQAEIRRWQAQVDVEKRRRVPDVTLSIGMQRNNELGRDQALFGVSIPLPVFDRNEGNLLEALRRSDKAGDELTAAAIRLEGELAQTHARLRNAHEEVRGLREDILPGAQSAHDAATKGFEFGKFDFLDVLDAQRTLLQTRTQYLRALADAHAAAAEIDRLLGVSSAVLNANEK